MTATEVSGPGLALPGLLGRSLRGAALAGASVAGAGAAGALVSVQAIKGVEVGDAHNFSPGKISRGHHSLTELAI